MSGSSCFRFPSRFLTFPFPPNRICSHPPTFSSPLYRLVLIQRVRCLHYKLHSWNLYTECSCLSLIALFYGTWFCSRNKSVLLNSPRLLISYTPRRKRAKRSQNSVSRQWKWIRAKRLYSMDSALSISASGFSAVWYGTLTSVSCSFLFFFRLQWFSWTPQLYWGNSAGWPTL